ncbi:MAG: lysylphosphatidylglycerol synthase transmembrane domain-containing protein [Gemmatimonadales bacterium]
MSSPSNPSSASRRWSWSGLLGVAISAALLVWVLHGISLRDVVDHARRANGWLLLVTIALATATFPLRALRWLLILRDEHGRRLPWRAAWHATAIGFMANNLLPARAGEVARAYVIHRQEPVRFTTALGSVGVERVFDGLVVLALMALAIAAPSFPAATRVGGRSLATLATGAAVLFGGLLLVALVVVHRPAPWVALLGRLSRRLARWAEGIIAGLTVLKHPARFGAVVGWTFLQWLVNAAAFAVCFRAFGLDVPLEAALLVQGIIGFGVAVPSTPGFVGVFEAATRITLAIYGVDATLAVSFALTYHVTTFVPITLLGLWSLSRLHLRLRELRAPAEGGGGAS